LAKKLLPRLKDYNDNYSIKLKNVLNDFIDEPKGELSDLIDNIPLSKNKNYNSLYDPNINMMLSKIFYPVED